MFLYFVLYSLARLEDNSLSISIVATDWIRLMLKVMQMWRPKCSSAYCNVDGAIDAEIRAVYRGAVALSHARVRSKQCELNCVQSVHFELECMRKAMWPAGRRVDASTQDAMISWIKSDEFFNERVATIDKRPLNKLQLHINLPLSAIPNLTGTSRTSSEDGSFCDTVSSVDTYSSVSSVENVDNELACSNVSNLAQTLSSL